MAAEQNDPIYRNAARRKNKRRAKMEKRRGYASLVASIKIALLRLFCVMAIFAFVVEMEIVLFYRIILKWILIFTFTCVLIRQIKEVEKKIKKSLRHCNAVKGQAK